MPNPIDTGHGFRTARRTRTPRKATQAAGSGCHSLFAGVRARAEAPLGGLQ
jgi:hypothetical protein